MTHNSQYKVILDVQQASFVCWRWLDKNGTSSNYVIHSTFTNKSSPPMIMG